MSPEQQASFAQMYRETQVLVNEMKEKTWALEVARGKFCQLQLDMRSYVQMNMIPSNVAPQQVPRPEAVAAVSFAEPLAEIVRPESTSASSTGTAPTSPDGAWLNSKAAVTTRSRSLERREKIPEPREATVLPAYAGNAQVRESSSAPAVRVSQLAAAPPPPPRKRFEVEVQPPLALGIEIKARPSGGVMDWGVPSSTGPETREAQHPFGPGSVAAGSTVHELSEVPAHVLRQAGIFAPGECTGEPVRYRDGSMMRNAETLDVYRVRRDGRAACTIYIVGVPFVMSERAFCTPFLNIGEAVALYFPREEWQDYKPHGTCTIRYRDPRHASEAVEQFHGAKIFNHLKPLKVTFANKEYDIDAPQDRQESTFGKPRFFGNVPRFPVEQSERPDADWEQRFQSN